MPRPKNSKNKIRPLRPFSPKGDFNAQEAREQNMIGKRLADARKRAHLTQPDVVNRLALLGVTCQAQAISKWEKGEEEEPEENEMDEYADSDGRIRPKIVLISYNEEYPPRYISPNTRFEIVGKVVG